MEPSDFLTPEEIKHYSRFLGQGAFTIFVHPDAKESWRWTATTVTSGTQNASYRYAAIAAVQELPTRDGLLLPVGRGPAVASSCQELARFPEIVWDVCGYYRRLGLRWTATKRQIRDALMKRKATIGAGKSHLVYAAKQLLDDGVRARYDRMPLGGVFLEDKDVQDQIKKAAHMAASAMASRGFAHVTPESVLGDWGFTVSHPGGPGGERTGQMTPPSLFPPLTGRILELTAGWLDRWTWYREPAVLDAFGIRSEQLETWQLLLVRAFSDKGVTARFAVGLCDSQTFRVTPAPDQGTLVVLLGEGEPSPELAAAAVDMWGLVTELRRRGDPHATVEQGRRER
jgi:hypothetical protein